jgi:pyruvate/2-oxoglutarate dehydrogenase complex dihydrolipoamide acyltransferase (E2) component
LSVYNEGFSFGDYRVKPTISIDRRVSDRAEAAQFMQVLSGFLEHPVKMLV